MTDRRLPDEDLVDPPRLTDGEAGSLFRSLRDLDPPGDLRARTLAGLGLPPAPAPPAAPPAAPAPLASSGSSVLKAIALKPFAGGFAAVALASGAAHVASAPPPPAAVTAPAPRAGAAPAARPPAATPAAPEPAALADPTRASAAATPAGPASAPLAPPPGAPLAPARGLAASPPGALAGLPSAAAVRVPAAAGDGAPVSAAPAGPPRAGGAAPPGAGTLVAPVVGLPGAVAPEADRAASSAAGDAPAASVAARRRLDIDREVALLDVARAALRGGSPGRTLEALDAYRAAYPAGQLATEALLLSIEARVRAGDQATATREARVFLAGHPRSPLAPRVRSLVGLPDETNP